MAKVKHTAMEKGTEKNEIPKMGKGAGSLPNL